MHIISEAKADLLGFADSTDEPNQIIHVLKNIHKQSNHITAITA
jgi:hypothetical protein